MKSQFNERIAHLQTNLKIAYLVSFSLMLILIGATFNFIAISSNNGLMPVYDKYSKNITINSPYHIAFTPETKHTINNFYLTDIINIDRDYYSIGDYLMFIGFAFLMALLLIQIYTTYKYKKFHKLKKV